MRVGYLDIKVKDKEFCCVCAKSFPPEDGPLPVLYWDGGELVGSLCPTCLAGGAEGLKRALLERARSLRNQAMLIDHELEAGVDVSARPVKRRTPFWQN